jgi:integrase
MWRERGQREYAKFPDEETARRVLAKNLSDVASGRFGIAPEKSAPMTLAKLAAEWLKRRGPNTDGKKLRTPTHRSWRDDEIRWQKHLEPRLGNRCPDEVDAALLRSIVEAKLAEGLASATCQRLIRLVSTFYSDLCERGLAKTNPAKGLPRSLRLLIKPSWDPKTTPFVERLEDVGRIYRALPEPVALAYAIGAMAGLRTGEILALRWPNVDLDGRRIIVCEQVQDGVITRPKDKDSRIVPVINSLLPVLREALVRTGGQGTVVQPMRTAGTWLRCDRHTLGVKLREAIQTLAKDGVTLPALTWYQATRHTFASQWVKTGGAIEKLRELMGHSTVLVTERYAHLRGDLFSAADHGRIAVELAAQTGKVVLLHHGRGQESEDERNDSEALAATGAAK